MNTRLCVNKRLCVYEYAFVCFPGLKPDTSAYVSGIQAGDVVMMVGHCDIKVCQRVLCVIECTTRLV